MKEKKHIDELFKQGFKDFEASPSPQVWDQIQAKLKEEKKKKKVIPLWIKLGGVAALLALLFTVGNSVFGPENASPTFTNTKEKTELNTESLENNNTHNNKDINNTEIVSEKTNSIEESTNKNEINKDSKSDFIKNSSKNAETEVAFEKDTSKNSDKKGVSSGNNVKDPINKSYNTKEAVALNEEKNNTLINKEKDIPLINKKDAVADKEVVKTKNTGGNVDKKDTDVAVTEESNKRSIFDAIEETNKEETIAVAKDNQPDNLWEITPNVGPVYYNTISDGSSIDPSFSDNPKSGDVNITYGVQVSYNLNKRLSVRSGLSNVNLSYSTTGLELGNGPIALALKSVDYNKSENVIIAADKGALANQSTNGEFGDITPKSTSGEPSLNQKISYFEVPLELKYAVLNKKFGVNLIGGFSTLLLGENEIFVDAGDFNETLGEANNLSTLSFTTNIGLGLNYSFSKKLMFNIEPMFKYQLNPYTESSVDFKPYYVGIYSGLSFKF